MLACDCVPPQGDRELAVKGEDGRLYHWILPSFFQLLKDLVQEGREFAVVFRTFGSDLARTLRAVFRALNEGAHPLFPDLSDLSVSRVAYDACIFTLAADRKQICAGKPARAF